MERERHRADHYAYRIMPNEFPSDKPAIYQIKLEGHLGYQWTEWFGNMNIRLRGGYTLLTGPVIDQAALHGVLKKVRDLGLPLVSVIRVERPRSTAIRTNRKKEKRK